MRTSNFSVVYIDLLQKYALQIEYCGGSGKINADYSMSVNSIVWFGHTCVHEATPYELPRGYDHYHSTRLPPVGNDHDHNTTQVLNQNISYRYRNLLCTL